MRVSINSNLNNGANSRVSFGGNRLLQLPVMGLKPRTLWEKVTGKPMQEALQDCFFTEMTKEDVPLAQEAFGLFNRMDYGPMILKGFLSKQRPDKFEPPMSYLLMEQKARASHFYMIEPKNPASPEKIKALAWVEEWFDDVLHLGYLQALKPAINKLEQGRGEGSAMMYGILRLAEKMNKRKVTLKPSSMAMPWYDRLGFEYLWDYNTFAYSLMRKDIAPALEHLEKRLNITSRPEFLTDAKRGAGC